MAVWTQERYLGDVERVIRKHGPEKDNLLAILLDAQSLNPRNYIPREAAELVAQRMGISLSEVYDVISFYSAFSDKPRGEHVIQLCESTTCKVTKYEKVRDLLEQELGIHMGETTPDNKFTLKYSPCFGACDIAPAIRIDTRVYGNLTEAKVKEIISRYRRL